MDLNEKLKSEIIETIRKHMDVKRIILFGSRARGGSAKTSDIDLAVEAENYLPYLKEILDEEVNTLLKFDIVDLKNASEKLKNEIQSEGIVIYEQKD